MRVPTPSDSFVAHCSFKNRPDGFQEVWLWGQQGRGGKVVEQHNGRRSPAFPSEKRLVSEAVKQTAIVAYRPQARGVWNVFHGPLKLPIAALMICRTPKYQPGKNSRELPPRLCRLLMRDGLCQKAALG